MEMYNHRTPLIRNIPYSPYELANGDWNNRPKFGPYIYKVITIITFIYLFEMSFLISKLLRFYIIL